MTSVLSLLARRFSLSRFLSMLAKEFIQMRRDRLTFAMLIGIPIMQLVLFGYAINSDPRHLPTAVYVADNSPLSRALVSSMRTSTYFDVQRVCQSRQEASDLLRRGEMQFVLTIPADFYKQLIRGERPVLLLEADATDPAATGNALNGFKKLVDREVARLAAGPLAHLRMDESPVELRLHPEYNPEAETRYNIVPGLMGVILTMTLVMITSLAMTRERERGTMENLLSTPVRPLEVLLGKIIPYILVGYLQITLILVAAYFLFQVPFQGSLGIIYGLSLFFIAANLSMGVTFSTFARNQLQAVQMSVFFFLPSLLLSGFMFPFRGMPEWAQALGSILPLTHFLRLVRGVLLKGNNLSESLEHAWPIMLFMVVVLSLAIKRYRQTLD